jgi:hypothetical protein
MSNCVKKSEIKFTILILFYLHHKSSLTRFAVLPAGDIAHLTGNLIRVAMAFGGLL